MEHIKDKLTPEQQVMAQHIEDYLPDSLFDNQYDLAQATNTRHNDWEEFLKIPEVRLYMDAKRNEYLRMQGFKALQSLTTHNNLTSSDVTAAKAMIEKSGILEKEDQETTVVYSFIPPQDPALKDAPAYEPDLSTITGEVRPFDDDDE